jgi:uncharacterized membrane protein YfcA
MMLLALILAGGILSGATAAISGFGIGSLLTPLLAARYGMSLAVAAVSIPHAIATAVRCWRLRASIDWSVLKSFGVLSAIGGLAGALLYSRFDSGVLTRILGVLLVATGIAAVTEWVKRLHPRGIAAQSLGLVSGFFGGIAGNQGGLRSGALMAFRLSPVALVATATATGLAVDAARMPVYLWTTGRELTPLVAPIGIATVGVLIGTFIGERLLMGLSARAFRIVVGAFIGLLGVWLLLSSRVLR